MAKLTKQNYMTIKGEKKINCYHLNLSKDIVKQANMTEQDELKVYVKSDKIIVEKVK